MKIEYTLKILHKASNSENYNQFHDTFLKKISTLDTSWSLSKAKKIPEIGANLSTNLSLTKLLPKNVTGFINYLFRGNHINGTDNYDDRIIIDYISGCDITKQVIDILPMYISGFNAYFATVNNSDISADDWDTVIDNTINKGIEFNSYNEILRVNPINYYSRELCKNVFNLTPEEIKDRLVNNVEQISLVHDGVFFVVTSEELPPEEHIKIDSKIRKLLR